MSRETVRDRLKPHRSLVRRAYGCSLKPFFELIPALSFFQVSVGCASRFNGPVVVQEKGAVFIGPLFP